MDIAISNWIFSTYGTNKFFATLWKWITFFGNAEFIITAIILLLCFKKTRKLGIYMIFAVGGVWAINSFILKPIIQRPRPFVENPELAGICNLAGIELPDEFSMPSGHSTASMAAAMTIFLFNKKWGGFSFFYPFLVGVSRIALCVHYATDVLVGWIVGAFVAIAVYFIINLFVKKYVSKKEKNNGKISSSISE